MRLKIELIQNKCEGLDMNYNYYLSSLCYYFIEKSNKDFACKLHNEGFESGNKVFKLFTFSNLICSKYEIDGSYITFKDVVYWYVSSPIEEFILYFAQSLLDEGVVKVGNVEFNVLDVELMKSPSFKGRMKFKAVAPIVVNTGNIEDGEFKQYYLSVEDEKFKENIKNNLIRKYYAIHKCLPDNLNFSMTILNADKCSRGKRIKIKNSFIKGYMPLFQVEGSEELIKVGYEAGVGSKNSQGFGLVEIV